MRRLLVAFLAFGTALQLAAQSERSQFEAGTIKPASPNLPGGRTGAVPPAGGPGTADPSRITYRAATLKTLLMRAYAAEEFQITGPAWLDSELFEMTATMPPGTASDQFRSMLQNLLTERFELKTHREPKEFSGYSLAVAKNGPKLKESGPAPAASGASADGPPQLGADGYLVPPQRPGMFLQLTGSGGARATFRQVTMETLATTLQSQLQRPVSEGTGLMGRYDFVLNFASQGLNFGRLRIPVSPGDTEPQPDIAGALQSQLGLRLDPKKSTVEVIVVDQATKTVKPN